MEIAILVVLVGGALAYAVLALRREMKPRAGGGCSCDCPQADNCAGTTCSVFEDALQRTTEDGRRKTEDGTACPT